ncbi:MAG: hypothetical protein ACP5KI_05350 [Brevinematia bacterium]
MGLLEKAKTYREKLIIESLQGSSNLFERKPVTVEDLKILKDYYEKHFSTSSFSLTTSKVSLLNLLVKVAEDVKYLSSVEGVVSSLYTVLSRLGVDIEGIGYYTDKLDVIYGEIEEEDIPTFFGNKYYICSNDATFVKVSGEMGSFLIAKCRGEFKLDEDEDMILKRCLDIISTSLRLLQFKSYDIFKFWGYRNSFLLTAIYSIISDDSIDENDRVIMLSYHLKEFFGLNFVIILDEENNYLIPRLSFDFPLDAIKSVKYESGLIGKNINNMEVIDVDLSRLFSYGGHNVAFVKFREKVLCFGANYDLSDVIAFVASL